MKRVFPLFFICALLAGCGSTAAEYQKSTRTVYAMDTVMTLTAYAPETGPEAAEMGLEEAEGELHRLDDLLSISKTSSDIYRLNQDPSAAISEETAQLIDRANEVSRLTDGDYDPKVAPLMELWGFRSGAYHVPSQAELEEALGKVEENRSEPGGIDLGGIAKGYASEQALSVIEAAGVSSAILSLGGNVGTLGLKPDGSQWTVAIQDPEQQKDYIATLSLGADGEKFYAITSGGYQRFFEENGQRYHHILDPKTGAPAETDLLSVTIVSADGTLADGLSTALFVKGYDEAVQFWKNHSSEFGMVLVTEDGLFATEGLEISSEQPITTLEVQP